MGLQGVEFLAESTLVFGVLEEIVFNGVSQGFVFGAGFFEALVEAGDARVEFVFYFCEIFELGLDVG